MAIMVSPHHEVLVKDDITRNVWEISTSHDETTIKTMKRRSANTEGGRSLQEEQKKCNSREGKGSSLTPISEEQSSERQVG
ncbi:hypothetical protein FACS189472_17910 [Alphaproteobacteria bacterium]|nr:hypothetical protein FACS189472_17910 [Alphaproteobacteria bacterium]